MSEDYLWDKSGEPDPQIQELEEILGTLRYQPKPLKLPRRRNHLPWLAIAATVAIALLAGGLWLMSRTPEASIPSVAITEREASIPAVAIAPQVTPIPDPPLSLSSQPPKSVKPRLTKYARKEAFAAKQQLMFALRLASEKLNAAHRRTQDKRSSYENTLPN